MHLATALTLGQHLLREHGLSDWTVVLDHARARFGVCRPDRRQIGLSRRLTVLSSEAEVRNTLLHEIAHALVGADHGHDAVWRARALAIGCDGRRTDDIPESAQGPWVGRCPAGHTVRRHRRPRRVGACRLCSAGPFDPSAIYTWTFRGAPAPMLASYSAELVSIRRRYGIQVAGDEQVMPG
ncbi:MAG: SprT-like domain-containing protein [Ornithinimicrobium sp.]